MKKHRFEIHGKYQGGLTGKGFFKGSHLEGEFSAPASLSGAGVGTNPEELLAAAANSCFLISLGASLGFQNVTVASIELKTEIEVQTEGELKFTSLTHYPKVALLKETTLETKKKVMACLAKAESFCLVSKAIRNNVTVTVHPEVISC
jgi:peroxiredoxin-like protein